MFYNFAGNNLQLCRRRIHGNESKGGRVGPLSNINDTSIEYIRNKITDSQASRTHRNTVRRTLSSALEISPDKGRRSLLLSKTRYELGGPVVSANMP